MRDRETPTHTETNRQTEDSRKERALLASIELPMVEVANNLFALCHLAQEVSLSYLSVLSMTLLLHFLPFLCFSL